MTKRDPSYSEFIDWVSQLDDSYKVYLFSLLNALFLFITVKFGIGIDPDSLKELAANSIITSFGNETLSAIWKNVLQPALWIFGLIQTGISIFTIWKFRLLGLVVSTTAFFGLLLLLFSASGGWPQWVMYTSIGMIGVSYVIARRNSKLEFDRNGSVIYDN